jgi:peptidoglycan/xylan/chitin deacetylase (PgdA/CDA1 family)
MASAFRALFYAGALAAGSWLGLGAPGLGEARDSLGSFIDRHHPKTPENAEAAHGSDVAPDYAPLPQSTNFQTLKAWPTLNAEASVSKAWMVAEGPAYPANSGRRLVTLTFDDGPFPETTPRILRELAKENLRATFFVIGRYLDGDSRRAQAAREALSQVVKAGHIVGNHTHDHRLLSSLSHRRVIEQIDKGSASIERVTGEKPVFFRPPFGALDEFGRAAVRDRGLDLLLWSIEKQDMQRADSHAMVRELVGQIEYKEGGIILLHDVHMSTAFALRELLSWLRAHRWDAEHPEQLGYEIVDMPTYLREVAASPLPYATRDELEKARRNKGRRPLVPVQKPERSARR